MENQAKKVPKKIQDRAQIQNSYSIILPYQMYISTMANHLIDIIILQYSSAIRNMPVNDKNTENEVVWSGGGVAYSACQGASLFKCCVAT